MNIQTSKIELIKLILGIDNPKILERITALLRSESSDFWDDLTPEQRADLDTAILELDQGNGIEWNQFKKSLQ